MGFDLLCFVVLFLVGVGCLLICLLICFLRCTRVVDLFGCVEFRLALEFGGVGFVMVVAFMMGVWLRVCVLIGWVGYACGILLVW